MKKALFASLLAVGVVLFFLGVAANKKKSAEVQALEKKIFELEARLADATKRTEMQASPIRESPRPTPKSTILPERTPVLRSKAGEQEIEERLEQISAHRMLRVAAGRYGEAIAKLGLDAQTASKILALYAEAYRVQFDTGAAARKAGITDPAQVKQIAMEEMAKVEAEIKNALGPGMYQSLQDEFAVSQEKSMIDSGFAQELAITGDRLTPDQSYALARAIWEVNVAAKNGVYPTPALQQAAQFEAAAKILPPRQMEAYRKYIEEVAELLAISSKLQEAKPTP